MVYVFLGHAGALPPAPDRASTSRPPPSASPVTRARCSASAIVGNDVNDDGRADIAIGAPMAGPPGKTAGGAVYVVFGSNNPRRPQHDCALAHRADHRREPPRNMPLGSRYDGFQENSHTGMSLAALGPISTATGTTISPSAPPTPTSTSRAVAAWPSSTASTGRPHHAQRPLGEGLPVLLPRRLPLPRRRLRARGHGQPARGRERRRRGRHDGRRLSGPRDRRAAGRLQRPHRLRLGLDHQRAPAAHRSAARRLRPRAGSARGCASTS